jgi:hypothetical protein
VVQRCQLCSTELDARRGHGHVVELERRSLQCTCRACYLLFTAEGAAGGRYRSVPERIQHDPDRRLSAVDWESLQIPVGTAFFFMNSTLNQVVASYPSPGGATECELDLSAWTRLAEEYPLLRAPEPDVEGILVHRGPDGFLVYLIPIDLCYALVGEVRLRWRGLDGGDEVRETLARLLADLQRRSRPLPTVELSRSED